jgi:hypothetical protein
MPTWVDRIRRKLADLKAADPEFRSFGAYQHQYRLGPTLSEDRLQKIEAYYSIELPADYRTFLACIGNGGAGPGYGLERFGTPRMLPRSRPESIVVTVKYSAGKVNYPVKAFADRFATMYWGSVQHLAKDRGLLSRPCPLRKTVQRSEMEVPDDDEGYEQWEREVWNPLDDGMLNLANYGCGMTAKLVITGRKRGTVWVADECDGEWIAEFRDCGSAVGTGIPQPRSYRFVAWYEHWLDNALESE